MLGRAGLVPTALRLLLALSLAATAAPATDEAAKQQPGPAGAAAEVGGGSPQSGSTVPLRRLRQLPAADAVPALVALTAGAASSAATALQQAGTASFAPSLPEWIKKNDTAAMACRQQGVSPYYTIHLAAVNIALHPEACGRRALPLVNPHVWRLTKTL